MKERKVSWLELFFDLIFVTAVSSVNFYLLTIAEHPQESLLYFSEYMLMIIPMWWAWVGQTMYMNRFGEYIKRPQLYMMAQMIFLILMTASFNLDFDQTYYTFIVGYLAIRAITVLEYYISSRNCSGSRSATAKRLAQLFTIGIVISAASLFFSGPLRYIIMYLGIGIDILLPLFNKTILKKVPVHFPHLVERFGLFVIITFGEAIVVLVRVLSQNTASIGVFFNVILLFTIVCCMFWSYYTNIENTIDKNMTTSGQFLLYGHFFIIVSILLFSVGSDLLLDNRLSTFYFISILYGSVALFFVSKHIVFIYHKKNEIVFEQYKSLAMLFSLIGFYVLCLTFNLSVELALIGLLIFTATDNFHYRKKK
ncbi:low temperature requirement protein A [Culicoidibacter larvae]|uniref:Low temperature requirement protein A n=1 Tax=Culicoidibacter larvae TaxID=2579976 RepID=A0A5R8QFU4_9FIRM|nr:low temperature requirement protein A [Culicoidibacter larvae]TLG76630.1 low temperature requirement protein A [Culicoidibacter larvae]